MYFLFYFFLNVLLIGPKLVIVISWQPSFPFLVELKLVIGIFRLPMIQCVSIPQTCTQKHLIGKLIILIHTRTPLEGVKILMERNVVKIWKNAKIPPIKSNHVISANIQHSWCCSWLFAKALKIRFPARIWNTLSPCRLGSGVKAFGGIGRSWQASSGPVNW